MTRSTRALLLCLLGLLLLAGGVGWEFGWGFAVVIVGGGLLVWGAAFYDVDEGAE